MSQSIVGFSDPLLTDQDLFTQAQLDQLFNTVGYDQTAYTEAFPEAAGDFGLQQYYTPPDSVAATSAPTPEFSDFNFGQSSTGYPTPDPNTPHPYPVEQQQCLDAIQDVSLTFRHRPQPVRSHINTSYLQPSHPAPGNTRRRSLSQGVIDYTAASSTHSLNPILMRLQIPRARSGSPGHAHKRRAGRHSRSTSQDTTSRGHHSSEDIPTSVPYNINGMVPTRIGDPISPDSPRYHRPAAQRQWPAHDGYAGDIMFRHMPPEQMERSRKIIEIGAITVKKHVDPALERGDAAIMKKIGEVERYLKAECGECDGALRGCATIRGALARKDGGWFVQQGANASRDTLDAPSNIVSDLDDDIFADGGGETDGVALMDMLMQEHATAFSDRDI
ncbi:uncharacterized protein M421DRAFT_170563 [Didymella exigua CBS 183.55]|uniref:Uncharacterized protein n=1 Tax=Didymella exigua CBS 183.55 TaxID=1150837 RepID=A0A6A5RJH4_9PLEO|nr:uncharacterized protein M421DRAFT_170563 [Didymella exigua CBS 183.55]KAF1927583.1 hypothetical protein M421DRAFT_170563 [Didymella exigua CBS 183.55]